MTKALALQGYWRSRRACQRFRSGRTCRAPAGPPADARHTASSISPRPGAAWPTKALHLIAAGEPQQDALLVGFDAFGQPHFHAEHAWPSVTIDWMMRAGIAGSGAERRHEGAIDLELAERGTSAGSSSSNSRCQKSSSAKPPAGSAWQRVRAGQAVSSPRSSISTPSVARRPATATMPVTSAMTALTRSTSRRSSGCRSGDRLTRDRQVRPARASVGGARHKDEFAESWLSSCRSARRAG